MKQTDQTLLEQMRITDFEIEHRKALFSLTNEDVSLLVKSKPMIEAKIDALVARFYELQTSIPEIALLIGDSDTLNRLKNAQKKYILDLFSGIYDLEYVNNRLRIGLVHKRIGVEPKLYLAAIQTLKILLTDLLQENTKDTEVYTNTVKALEKLITFDIVLVFETYIRSLVAEIETSKNKSEQYARVLEDKVRERTQQLEEMTRTDPLTGLLNMRYLNERLLKVLRSAQRRSEQVTVVYLDINNFKQINDQQGHQRGDEILRTIGGVIRNAARADDLCFRCGGDEFCVVLSNVSEEDAMNLYCPRLNDLISQYEDNIYLSFGCSQAGPDEYPSPEELLRQADHRMYAMKQTYRSEIPSTKI